MKLHHNVLILFIFLNAIAVTAQDFQGIATYKSSRKIDLKLDENENAEMQKQLQEQLQKQFQQEYTLTFDKNQSLYKKNEKLAAPAPAASHGIQISVSDGSDLIYKNIKENRFTNKTELYGKLFLIKDTLTARNWELTNETKNIGEYTCYKAIFKDEYTTQTLDEKMETTKETKERITSAWYTPQVPIANGPADFQGLPGLILEINDGQMTLICSRIVLNMTDKVEITEPSKGKEVNQKKFDEISTKKSEEMIERFKSKRGNGGGDGERVIIKVGG